MTGWSAGTFGIILLSYTFLISLTHYDRRIEVKRVIIKDQLRKKYPNRSLNTRWLTNRENLLRKR